MIAELKEREVQRHAELDAAASAMRAKREAAAAKKAAEEAAATCSINLLAICDYIMSSSVQMIPINRFRKHVNWSLMGTNFALTVCGT